MNIILPYLHILFVMVLMGTLITEHILLKPDLTKEQINALAITDMIFGISAGLVLITGLLRWFFFGKGFDYYLYNHLFHIKLTLFVIVGILSIFPTKKILKWRKQAKNGSVTDMNEETVKKQLMIIRIELLLVALIPLFAVMVARGYGT